MLLVLSTNCAYLILLSAQEDSLVHLVQRFAGQCSSINFCTVSAVLFFSVVDVLVKRGAKLFTNYHLVICILRGLNHLKTRKRFSAQKAYKIKWELLADKNVRHTFTSKVASLFRELPDFTEDVETEFNLFKSAVSTSATASCSCKRIGGQTGSEKRTAWWNQEVKEATHAKKAAFRAWLKKKSSEQL